MDQREQVDRTELKELFFAALEVPPGERESFLDGLRADQGVIQVLRTLLSAHDEAGSFLDPASVLRHLDSLGLAPGTRLGPYEIVDLIGRGGMGEVYRARDTRLGRHVAVKVLPPALAGDPGRRKRFEEEARAASALNHPGVLTVYDVGTLDAIDGSAFLVMELLEGETLRARLQREPPLTWDLAIDYAVQIAHGLAAAHTAGIVHRDIKPENLFLTNDGRIKILDFGIAKLASSPDFTRTATQAGALIGTVGYIAPEQARGQGVDARADIFSFGAVLFEMVTGQRAFSAASPADTLSAILHADPLQRLRAADRSGAVFGVIERCLAKEPAGRYQRFADVVTALTAITRPGGRSPGWWRSSRILGAAVLLLIVLAGGSWLGRSMWRTPRSPEAPGGERVFAVLPFENISADQSQAYFASGMTEELTAQVAGVSSLRVLSRAAVAGYGNVPNAARRIRDELGVDTLLTGSVRVAGGSARISVQLVNTDTNQAIWSKQFDERLTDVLQVQRAVATQILSALDARLSAAERQRLDQVATNNPAAYDLYLKSSSGVSGEQAAALLKEAIRLDPKFAAAHAGLSRVEGQLGDFGNRQFYADSLASARRAVEADPNEARGHHALGVIQLRLGHLAEARLAFLRAMELSPSLALAAFDLSVTDATLGHFDESLYWARRGFALAPNLAIAYYHVGIPLLLLADVAAADRWFQAAELRFPTSGRIQYMWSESDFLAGRVQAADARIRKARAAFPNNNEVQAVAAQLAFLTNAPDALSGVETIFAQSPQARAYLLPETFRTMYAYLLQQRGQNARSAELLDEALRVATESLEEGDQTPEVAMEIAAIHAYRGERDEALTWLNAGYRTGARLYREIDRDPFFSALRSDPQFKRVRQQMESDVVAMRGRVNVNDTPELPPVLAPRLPPG